MEDGNFDGVLIDGAVPRSQKERVGVLLDALTGLGLVEGGEHTARMGAIGDKLAILAREQETHGVDPEWWEAVEREVIDLINEVLPDGYVCTEGETCPGDVVITTAEEDD